MKSGLAIGCALSLLLGSVNCPAIVSTAAPLTLPASTATATAAITADGQFFVDHPDLKDEADVVDQASKALAAEGYQPASAKEASDTLAAKSRSLLADRTPEEWQQKAVDLYPALGVAGSEFNELFVKHYRELKATSPAFAEEPSWPVLLAKRCDDELRAGTPPAAQTVSTPDQTARVTEVAPPLPEGKNRISRTHRATHFWQTFLGLLLLIGLIAVPCALLFRPGALALSKGALDFRKRRLPFRKSAASLAKERSNPPPPPERSSARKGEPSIWRATLKHAAIIYIVAALPASFHSFTTNADLGFIDRVFVSLLVGLFFGLFITLPLYGIDTLWHACQKHPARHATR